MSSSERELLRLLEIEISSVLYLRYQNYQLEPYLYQGNSFEFLPFSIDSDPQASIDLDNAPSSISISNAKLVRNLVEANDGLRRAIVTITSIYLDDLNRAPVVTRTQILKPSYQGASIQFQLESPVNAIVGRFPSVFFTGDQWRELPISSQASLR